MFGIGIPELVIILIILLVLFGGKNLPELSKNIGTAIREIRKGFTDEPAEKKPQKDSKSKK